MRHRVPIHLLFLFLTLLGLAGAAGTPAGTVIENQATFQALPSDPTEAPMMNDGGANARIAATGTSSAPTCTPAAPAMIAMSARSFTSTGTGSADTRCFTISRRARGEACLALT